MFHNLFYFLKKWRQQWVWAILAFSASFLLPSHSQACSIDPRPTVFWPENGALDIPLNARIIIWDSYNFVSDTSSRLTSSTAEVIAVSLKEDTSYGHAAKILTPLTPLKSHTTYTLSIYLDYYQSTHVTTFTTGGISDATAPQLLDLGIHTLNYIPAHTTEENSCFPAQDVPAHYNLILNTHYSASFKENSTSPVFLAFFLAAAGETPNWDSPILAGTENIEELPSLQLEANQSYTLSLRFQDAMGNQSTLYYAGFTAFDPAETKEAALDQAFTSSEPPVSPSPILPPSSASTPSPSCALSKDNI